MVSKKMCLWIIESKENQTGNSNQGIFQTLSMASQRPRGAGSVVVLVIFGLGHPKKKKPVQRLGLAYRPCLRNCFSTTLPSDDVINFHQAVFFYTRAAGMSKNVMGTGLPMWCPPPIEIGLKIYQNMVRTSSHTFRRPCALSEQGNTSSATS